MHIIVNRTQFHSIMLDDKDSSYSGKALDLIFDYFEDQENMCRESIQFSTTEICRAWQEASAEDVIELYGHMLNIEGGASISELIEQLEDHTFVLGTTTGNKILFASSGLRRSK